MNNRAWTALRVAYVASAALLLAWMLVEHGEPLDNEAFRVMSVAMMVLSFPLGLASAIVFASLAAHFPALAGHGVPAILSTWTMSFLVGYLQWFVLLRWFIDRRIGGSR